MGRKSRRRSVRLQRLVDLAETDERRLAEALGRLQRELGHGQTKLSELDGYRTVYAGRGVAAGSSAHWKDHQDFLTRLDHAIAAQRQIVADAERMTATARERWMQQRQRLASLKKVLEKSVQAEADVTARQEQKRLDETPVATSPFLAERDTD